MDIVEFLQNTPLFAELSRKAIWRLADLAQIKDFVPDDILIKEGGSGAGCFIIISGKVVVVKNYNTSKEKKVAELGVGEIIGEMNIIDDQPHSATVRAIEATQCVTIGSWDFKAQMQAYPEIALQLLPVIVRRLREAENRVV